MKCQSGCQVLEVMVQKPQILDYPWDMRYDPAQIMSAAQSLVSYSRDLSGSVFISGCSKLE